MKQIKIPNIFKSSKSIVFFLTLTFLVFLLLYTFIGKNEIFGTLVSVYGGFVATLIGVYLSLFLTNKQSLKDEERKEQKILRGSLMLLKNELSVNKKKLNDIIDILNITLKTPPYSIGMAFLQSEIELLKTQTFYAIISSGGMKEISTTDFDLFTKVALAYYNLDTPIASFKTTKMYFKGTDSKKNEKNQYGEEYKDKLVNVIENINEEVKIIEEAINLINNSIR